MELCYPNHDGKGEVMTSRLDIYRSAHALIQQHGEAAANLIKRRDLNVSFWL